MSKKFWFYSYNTNCIDNSVMKLCATDSKLIPSTGDNVCNCWRILDAEDEKIGIQCNVEAGDGLV